jgi:hypothetical protein
MTAGGLGVESRPLVEAIGESIPEGGAKGPRIGRLGYVVLERGVGIVPARRIRGECL